MAIEWINDGPNLLAPNSLAVIRQAFSCGPVFGRHYHYAGGRSGDNWAFHNFEQFWEYVSYSKPGDLYFIWSLPALLDCQLALLHLTLNAPATLKESLDHSLATTKEYLEIPFNEFFALFSLSGHTRIEVQLNDIDGFEDLRENILHHGRLGSEIIVFPFTTIEADKYVLVKAKYSNSEGKVPLGGPY